MSSSERLGAVVAGRFRLEARIGVGGMGEVFRATHLDLGVPVAVKLLGPAIAGQEKAVTRFRREARAAARLKSAHIVHVYDFGVDGDVPFLVMELLDGESLAERLERVGVLTLRDACLLVDQAARGLGVAHEQGIVHRDVKPSNLLLARTADGEALKVLDFGIAKPDDEGVTITSSKEVVGSPLHMSPEQAHGDELDQRADVWALATVAFRMITGADAFAGPTTSSVLIKICSGVPPRASAVAPGLSPAIDAFFEKAFAADIGARFRSVAELARAFAVAAGGAPDTASPTGTDFSRAHATVSLEPLSTTPPPDRPARPRSRSRSRWAWVGIAASLLAAPALWFVSRGSPEPPPASSGATSADTPLSPRTQEPALTAPPTLASIPAPAVSAAPPPAPSGRSPQRSAAKSVAKPAPSTRAPSGESAPASTAPPSADKKRRDPLFGL